MEIELIKAYDSTNPSKGYNLSRGGDKTTYGFHHTEQTRRLISAALTGKRKGIPHTEEHSAHISAALKGCKRSDATKEKLRRVLGDRFQTAEARANQLRNTPRGAKHAKAKAVLCVETAQEFETIAAASLCTGTSRNGIALTCEGKQKTAGGYHWQYVIDTKG